MTYAWAHLARAALPRFFSKTRAIAPPEGKEHLGHCLLYMGARTKGGGKRPGGGPYGSFYVGYLDGKAIIVRTTVFVGVASGRAIPGQPQGHRCGRTLCVREAHMETITARQNSLERWDGKRIGDKA